MGPSPLLEQEVSESLQQLAQQLRVDSVRCSTAASSGHPASALSAADLMAVLLTRYLHYDFTRPDEQGNDHLIFSKGHAAPLYYAMLRAVGAIDAPALPTSRRAPRRREGNPTPRRPWGDVATGSPGQGLPIGVGLGMAGKTLDQLPYRVWVLCGDGELSEGSMWEAAEQAGSDQLDNLTVIVDVNRLGQRGPTRHGWNTAAYATRFRAFGWNAIEIDGHDVEDIDQAFCLAASHADAPTVILARTKKGRGVPWIEDRDGQHGQPVPDPAEAIRQLGGLRDLRVQTLPPLPVPAAQQRLVSGGRRLSAVGGRATRPVQRWQPPRYPTGSMASTRAAFGAALAALGDSRPDVVVLDGDASDTPGTSIFAEAHPKRFFQLYVAEQQLLATAVGMQVRGGVPFAATYAAFFTRAYDFIRMAAISRASIRLVGSHAGLSAAEDGPAQMALEDIAALRAVFGSTVLCPCDANQAAWLTGVMSDLTGVSYMRTCRDDLPVIYQPGQRFEVGGSRVLRSSPDDQVTLVAAGMAVHEALAAADLLADDGIAARVIDAYSVKPIDAVTLRAAARDTGRIVTVEDHWPEGGLGDAVLSALAAGDEPLPAVRKLAVRVMPFSATPALQVQLSGIDMATIATAAAEMVGAGLA